MRHDRMEYTRLGTTGLEVSRLCLGTMNFGSEAEWMVNDRSASIELIQEALDRGINFIDTANTYSNGESESIVGDAIDGYDREQLVIATKAYFPAVDDPGLNQQGLSRKHLLEQVEHSLDRLGTDYIDLYQIHRWDDDTPIEETLAALDSLVRTGKVRYVGASTMAAWQFMKALATSDLEDYERFVSMQPEYSLVSRHEEENVLPLCRDQDIGVLPWSPLAGGFLAGKYSRDADNGDGRLVTEDDSAIGERYSDAEWAVLETVREIAADRNVTPAQVSIAWLLQKEPVTAPVIGPRTQTHLDDLVDSLQVSLTSDEISRLEAPVSPTWSSDLT